jgi:hypothetical protein
MGGLILFKILVFLLRTILRIVREIRSEKWNRTEAMIDGSYAPEHESFPYASLTYLYSLNGEEHSGRYETGFSDDYSAAELTQRYPEGTKIVIRYRPGQLDQSYFSESDQAVSDPFSGSRR